MSATEYADWGELHTKLQPLARRLYEAMSRQEWDDVELLACDLRNTAFEIQRLCIRHNTAMRVAKAINTKPTTYLYEV